MLRSVRDRLTYSNVMATTAVFVALGGTSYAAITLPRNSVGSNQIRSNAVRSVEVRDRSIEARDLSLRARNFLKGQRGPAGPQGPAGGTGASGSGGGGGGTSGFTTATVRSNTTGIVPAAPQNETTIASKSATCDPGERATGGGAKVENTEEMAVHDSYPSSSSEWTVNVGNDAQQQRGFTVYVVCIR